MAENNETVITQKAAPELNNYYGNPQYAPQQYAQQQYAQQQYAQQQYAQQQYAQQQYAQQQTYGYGQTLNTAKKFPILPIILIGVATLIDLYDIVGLISGHSDAMTNIVNLLYLASYALLIVDVAMYKSDKHIFAGISMMIYASVLIYNIIAYNYFPYIAVFFNYDGIFYGLRTLLLIVEPVFMILAGLYFLLQNRSLKSMKLVAAIIIMAQYSCYVIFGLVEGWGITFYNVLYLTYVVCFGLGLIFYNPVKE